MTARIDESRPFIPVRIAVGRDIASALVHPRLRRGLATRLKLPQEGLELTFWAPTTNAVLLTRRPLVGRSRQGLRAAAAQLVRAGKLPPGHAIDLEIREKMTAKAAGIFTTGGRGPSPPRQGNLKQ